MKKIYLKPSEDSYIVDTIILKHEATREKIQSCINYVIENIENYTNEDIHHELDLKIGIEKVILTTDINETFYY